MTWIKLNDNAPQHPKVAALSDRAFRVWIHSLCYCAQFQTDGILPTSFLAKVQRRTYEELVAAGLWVAGQSVVVIHDYLKHQTSKAKIEAERRRTADRRTTGGRPEKDRDQKIEVQKVEGTPPLPPSREGGSRVRREHKAQARAILKAHLGWCPHDDQCETQTQCFDRLAHELAQKEASA